MSIDSSPRRKCNLDCSPNVRHILVIHSAPTSLHLQSATQPHPSPNTSPHPTSNLSCKPRSNAIANPNPWFILNLNFISYLNSSPDFSSTLVPGSPVPQLQQYPDWPCLHFSSDSLVVGPSMSMTYEDLQSLGSEKKSQRISNGKKKGEKVSSKIPSYMCRQISVITAYLYPYHVHCWSPQLLQVRLQCLGLPVCRGFKVLKRTGSGRTTAGLGAHSLGEG